MQSSTHDCNSLEMNDRIFNRKQVYCAEYPIITSPCEWRWCREGIVHLGATVIMQAIQVCV